ncbi:MAG: YjdF family protein [Desulfotomaculaceae bacterium]
MKLTVYHDGQFWVGVFEEIVDEKLKVEAEEPIQRKINPKRLSREVAQAMKEVGISTKAQQALQLEREKNKSERKVISRQLKEELAEKKWLLKTEKARNRHRGR